MPNLHIPDEGLAIPGPSLQVPDEKPNARAGYPAPFAVKINITERFLEELSSGKQNSLQLNTGKGRMSLQIGSNQFEYVHTPELFHNELYRQSNDDTDEVVPFGMLKDKLELLEVVEKGVDADLLVLKQQMEALQKQKDKRSVQLISNPSQLGPELSGRRGLIAAKKAGIVTAPSMKTKVNRRTKFSSSMPNSPALTATNSPAGRNVTSVPSKPKSIRKDPLYLPLIHLLALGPEREQMLAVKTHTDLDRCSSLVIQIANRGISGRWQLFDNMYKELDVWKFKYPKQEMRELAIENAEDAFDRLKLPEDAPEWELLRKPEDRGKPRPPRQVRRKPEPEPAKKKPVAAAASPALPPTIKISKNESISSPALVAEPMARSISQPIGTTVAKPRGNAENNALKKIIGNKKSAAKLKAPTTKAATPKEKKATTTSTATPVSTPSTTLSKPSTTLSSKSPAISSSATPSSRAKPTAKARTEFKSAEFISDSDSDIERMDIDIVPSQKAASSSSSSSSSSSAQPLYKKSAKASAQADGRSQSVSSKRPPTTSVSAASPSTNGHRRNTSLSASPAKPSPLGSSPPMTASDVRQSSTASSSPLSSVPTPDDVSTPMMDIHTSYTSVPVATPKSSAEKTASRPRYIPDRGSTSPQPRRKVESATAERPRKRVLSSASDSDGGRKRKEPPEERPMIARKAPKTSQTSDVTKARKGPVKTVANGVSKKEFEEVRQQRKDLPRTKYASSTTSTASTVSISSSDASSRGGRSRYRYAEENIALLAKYRRLHDDYRSRYERVRQDPNPPEDRVKQVIDLHNRLAEMKLRIHNSVLTS
ncbi:hypothetical protein DRE_01518 [Drechslerella stenobrocha 248]|uniref:Uncharacterized protein n=1 Tax=Drechslerella stenobrocha 248 TaxID=1043628 RepID=W7HIC7_9PEZI|nr:hypothetical protein DRE_01518 [Drechslerella stenobrocha 248]